MTYLGLIESQTPEPWEIVVWDWHNETPVIDIDPFGKAYYNAKLKAADLNIAISSFPYKYVHMIGHSAGARLIDIAANLAALHNNVRSIHARPFIHLTFLDAYTRTDKDSGKRGGKGYGYLKSYPDHYAEHYVDRGLAGTDACLSNALNFDITNWTPSARDWPSGHQGPRYWYQGTVTTPGFAHYGHPLSFEGGNVNYIELAGLPKGQQCPLLDNGTSCIPASCPFPGSF